jgi:hypothetical protein
MTEQTRHFVELSDVLSFRLECPDCHCSVVFPVAKFQGTPRSCPNGCGKQWEQLHARAVADALSEFVGSIQMVERITLHTGLLFSLEIAKPAKTQEPQE